VSVLAPTAAEAVALSTAFYLLGPDAARTFIGDHPEIGAIFIDQAADGRPRLQSLGLDDLDFDATDVLSESPMSQ
jgi:thiamine biosynthesis lipoprotein